MQLNIKGLIHEHHRDLADKLDRLTNLFGRSTKINDVSTIDVVNI